VGTENGYKEEACRALTRMDIDRNALKRGGDRINELDILRERAYTLETTPMASV
jgi:hypothetical protein